LFWGALPLKRHLSDALKTMDGSKVAVAAGVIFSSPPPPPPPPPKKRGKGMGEGGGRGGGGGGGRKFEALQTLIHSRRRSSLGGSVALNFNGDKFLCVFS